ncbi:MAG: LLM class flavin-dependent oxidoreductase [Novosphingobium sp.]|uniref:LLM class flavin-dependent oxidoreductase n=1 Tax=Novosphingobium sp. TaxID=1874826 RepID=UPI001D633D3E|nr:LLM class flavin-dependent oxidoreductase [Novosphingobium sp.]MCB2056530.1 LLM class flavin-dependent oxidoreductase [Novosphingobium sp.]MCP5386293.1 LLM class flavin-dependent oxidoreductase [Novosphingobium sp.]
MIDLSVLDLVPVREGGSVGEALSEAALLAAAAEKAGYKRFWVAEHHAMEGIAGGATAVTLAHIGHATTAIRIGAGGIMLPNHNPFVIAEQFGTLDALFPGRVDLGLGRAPGADLRIAQALRRDLARVSEYFPQDVVELRALITGEPELAIRATPGFGAAIEFWMLGSSLFGAQLAAALGMPYAFASHFAPDHLDQALRVYRERFQPSRWLEQPRVMAAMNVICAETDAEAVLLASSMDQSFVALRSGNPGKLRPPVPGYRESLSPSLLAMLEHVRQASAIGAPSSVREAIARFVERTGADEIIVSGATFDPAARRHSLELTVEVLS